MERDIIIKNVDILVFPQKVLTKQYTYIAKEINTTAKLEFRKSKFPTAALA